MDQSILDFQEKVWHYYDQHKRSTLPWRQGVGEQNWAYHVYVSEVMLQQTQVARVVPKYTIWLEAFPTIADLARASLADCLRLWNGLGYNRRAKYLHDAAKQIHTAYNDVIPEGLEDLCSLAGIGANTAAAIAVYAYNKPHVYIETNIRSVFLHHFFQDAELVSDAEIRELVTRSLDRENPREWYWALMDYGAFIKAEHGAHLTKSKHYTKQSAFVGSKRQLRGKVIRLLAEQQRDEATLSKAVDYDARLQTVLNDLISEKLIIKTGVVYRLNGD